MDNPCWSLLVPVYAEENDGSTDDAAAMIEGVSAEGGRAVLRPATQ